MIKQPQTQPYGKVIRFRLLVDFSDMVKKYEMNYENSQKRSGHQPQSSRLCLVQCTILIFDFVAQFNNTIFYTLIPPSTIKKCQKCHFLYYVRTFVGSVYIATFFVFLCISCNRKLSVNISAYRLWNRFITFIFMQFTKRTFISWMIDQILHNIITFPKTTFRK